MLKRIFTLFLLLLVGMLSCMLPLRHGLKYAAKLVMQVRLAAATPANGNDAILIAAADAGGACWDGYDEFRLDQVLYDVSSTEYHKGVKYYRCVADVLEARAERGADEVTAELLGCPLSGARGKGGKSLISWLQELYCPYVTSPMCGPLFYTGQTFYGAAFSAVEEPFTDSRIIPPEA